MRTDSRRAPGLLACALLLIACDAREAGPPSGDPAPESAVEAVSLLGAPLRRPRLDEGLRPGLERELAEARERLAADPGETDAWLAVSRCSARLGRLREAVAILDEGIARHPGDPRLYRDRGRRLIALRRFDDATVDLLRAAELLDDGAVAVDAHGVWYHLGLAQYLTGTYQRAETAFEHALAHGRDDDGRVAASFWLYLACRRQGKEVEARAVLRPIHEGLHVADSGAYLAALLMFVDRSDPEELLTATDGGDAPGFAIVAYAAANVHLHAGNAHRAERLLREITARDSWTALGHIAAEADLARLGAAGY